MRNRRSSIMLIEIMVAILLFALASAVCLRLFVYAKTLAEDSRDLSTAVRASTTIEEVYLSSKSPDAARDTLAKLYDNCEATEFGGNFIYDADTDSPLHVRFVTMEGESCCEAASTDGVIKVMITCTTTNAEGEDKTVYETTTEVFYEE